MTAVADIRSHAQMFGWDLHTEHLHDTIIRGPHMLTIDYTRAGTVAEAKRYFYYKISDPEFREQAAGRNKRTAVISWLVEHGS